MRGRLAVGAMLACGLPVVAGVPPMVPVLPPTIVERLSPGDDPLTDPAELAKRIQTNTKAATVKLADKAPDGEARKAQRQVLRDIDELLKLAENQPPPPMPPMGGDGSPPPPMGGEGGKPPPPMGGGGQPAPQGNGKPPMEGGKPSGGSPSGQPMPTGGSPMPTGPQAVPVNQGGQPQPTGQQQAGANPLDGRAAHGKPAMPLDDPIAKQVWGHLPDTVRKQMSQYYQEQFMPRYGGLLRDYFSAIAEREKTRE